MISQAIILAGGFGTRLQTVVKDVPKPMAPINGKPFLDYLVLSLKSQGINHVVFSVGYKHDIIKQYFDDHELGVEISYSIEDEPLGTGGAINLALSKCREESVIVVNGDTFADLDYSAMSDLYADCNADICLGLVKVENTERYGKVDINNDGVVSFKEKGEVGEGLINCGTYIIKKDLFEDFNMPSVFSFENDFLYPKLSALKSCCYISDAYFIDIGIPEDYARAENELVGLTS